MAGVERLAFQVPLRRLKPGMLNFGADGKFWPFIRSHPVVLLLLLTPGIPEYLSSSSAINAIVLNPPLFGFQLLANLGLYGPGALLIHEAKVQWKKGWASVLLLGAAYGILEEGVALSTLFNPNAGPVGTLGIYGHWLGVNWVWSAGIVPFHALWSVSLPILLLGLAIPATKSERLLSKKRVVITLGTLGLDVLLLIIIVYRVSGYWMGWPNLILSLLAITVLVWSARGITAGALTDREGARYVSNGILALIGISFFPVVFFTQVVGEGARIPAIADFTLLVIVQTLYLVYLVRKDWRQNQRGMIALAFGLIIPIAVFGAVAEFALPMTLLADALLVLFFSRLWKMYPALRGLPAVPSDPKIGHEQPG